MITNLRTDYVYGGSNITYFDGAITHVLVAWNQDLNDYVGYRNALIKAVENRR